MRERRSAGIGGRIGERGGRRREARDADARTRVRGWRGDGEAGRRGTWARADAGGGGEEAEPRKEETEPRPCRPLLGRRRWC